MDQFILSYGGQGLAWARTGMTIPQSIQVVCCRQMRRAIHIAVTIVAVLLLVRPYDCFGAIMTRKAADCCAKGKCLPTRDADECCKNTAPSGNQILASRPHSQSVPIPHFDLVRMVDTLDGQGIVRTPRVLPQSSPPGSPPGSRSNLPLLI